MKKKKNHHTKIWSKKSHPLYHFEQWLHFTYIAFIDFRMVPGGLLGLRESRRAPRCIILWFWALLKNQVFGPKMLTLPNRLKICFSKAERNQFSDFNMNYHVKPRQFQAHMDQFWRCVGQIFDLRSRSQNRKNRIVFFSDSLK